MEEKMIEAETPAGLTMCYVIALVLMLALTLARATGIQQL